MTHPPSSPEAETESAPVGDSHAALEAALSADRFARYAEWAAGNRDRALEFYTLNARVSEAMYIPLQALEVALRNRIDAVLKAAHGERWFEDPAVVTLQRQQGQVAEAIADLAADGKPRDPGRIIAALTFSFWTSFFGRPYEGLWRRTLRHIATRQGGQRLGRKDFATSLTQVRILRNRIAHHEPILYWNLPQLHAKIVELTGWLSPALVAWAAPIDRFTAVYPPTRLELARVTPPVDDARRR